MTSPLQMEPDVEEGGSDGEWEQWEHCTKDIGGKKKCEQNRDAERENRLEGAITGQKAKGAWKIANVLLSHRTNKALPANFGSLLFPAPADVERGVLQGAGGRGAEGWKVKLHG